MKTNKRMFSHLALPLHEMQGAGTALFLPGEGRLAWPCAPDLTQVWSHSRSTSSSFSPGSGGSLREKEPNLPVKI